MSTNKVNCGIYGHSSLNECKPGHLYYLSILTITLAITLMFLGVWMLYIDSNPPVTFIGEPFNVTIYNNTYMGVTLSFCKHTDVPSKITRCFSDGLVFCTPEEASGALPKGCHYNITRYIPIPRSLPNGEYKLISVARYEINSLATRTSTMETQKFTINRTNK
ncbi:MAG: hypothetical protein WC444_05525 [Candidatus Paceibacterota bacterium]